MVDSLTTRRADTQVQVRINSFIQSVYNWMAIGLALTGGVAYFISHNPALNQIVNGNPLTGIVIFIALIGIVVSLSARIQKIQASTATGLFIVFAALFGVSLSSIFMVYTKTSIASTFFICAGTFTACSIYGMTTKRDLSSLGGFMFMGLIGIIIASVVNLFIHSSAMAMIISYIGVFVFVGLTAYDTQKLKHMALTQPAGLDAGVIRKGAIIGALSLYLDFINLFIFLLQILGNGRR